MPWQAAHGIVGLYPLCALAALLLLPGAGDSDSRADSERTQSGQRFRFLSPRGSDRAPGTAGRPWRTLAKAVRSARPGDTIVVRAGAYGRRGEVSLFDRGGRPGSPITFRGAAGGRPPKIVGAVKIAASHLRFRRFDFAGPTGRVKRATPDNPRGENVQVAIDANGRTVRRVQIHRSVVRGSHWHAGIYVANAEDARIVGNYIHDNGDPSDPGQANLSHGIYWHSGSGLIANNVVEDNVARGIQLYPNAAGVVVIHNTVVGNGAAGIQLGARSSRNLVFNNVVVFNGGAGVRPAALSGVGNVARRNLLWGNAAQREWSAGLISGEAIHAPPLFGHGYLLRQESSAVDRAIEARSPPVDRLGVARPRGRLSDLGALESW